MMGEHKKSMNGMNMVDVLCINIYENTRMKPVETVLRTGEREEGE
jgi:hypothetical protein